MKSTPNPGKDAFRGLWALQEEYPDQFHRGYVIAPNAPRSPHGENMWTLPLSALKDHSLWE
ncbi:hypothetical protein [Nesterenkonia populi]|uniref:hypothetical protein n=1 Tax=Nesterenkonia populi TaxID=1591087 RepID=UPI001FE92B9A|nr:hypothetical protein [Nesterenkonia populi]